jgi:hypothetical protein
MAEHLIRPQSICFRFSRNDLTNYDSRQMATFLLGR